MTAIFSPLASRIFALASDGKTYNEIQQVLKINASALHTHAYRIKQRMGVSLKEVIRTAKGLPPKPDPLKVKIRINRDGPTFRQREIMSLVVQGRTYAQIAHTLHITPQAAQNAASQGCARAGIKQAGHSRTAKMRAYLEREETVERPPVTMDDPMF